MNDLPPNSPESERGVLGCLLLDASLLDDARSAIKSPEAFYSLANREVWLAMLKLADANKVLDVITVVDALKAAGKLDQVGGLQQVMTLSDNVPSAANLPTYLETVADNHVRRHVLKGAEQLSGMARNGHTLAEIAEHSERLLAVELNAPPILGGRESATKLINDLQRRFDLPKDQLSGISTGFSDLDEYTEGWQAGEMSVIGARPSIGKTAIGVQMFAHVVFDLGLPALFYSLEMSTEALMRRMLGMRKHVNLKTLRKGHYDEQDFRSFGAFAALCRTAPMHIIDATGPNVSEVCATIRRAVRKHGIKVVFLDYLQKIRPSEKHEKRTYEVGDVSGKLKGVAKQLGISIVCLAQLNRENEKDKVRLPRLTDLADSAQIERDADLVALLHRDRTQSTGEATLLIAKQRDGEVGAIPLTFLGQFGRFEQRAAERTQGAMPYND